MKTPVEEAIDEIKECQAVLFDGGIPCDREDTLVDALKKVLAANVCDRGGLDFQLSQFLLMLGRVAFACHSSVYTTIALLHRSITPRRPMGDMEKCDPTDIEDIEEVAIAIPRILDILSAEWMLLPQSAAQPDFSDIESICDPPATPEEASEEEECMAQAYYTRDFGYLLTVENVSKILTQLTRAAEAFKKDQPPRVDEEDGIDFVVLSNMVEKLAELSYDRWLKHGSVKRVYVITPELERQKQVINKTMTLVSEIRDYVNRKRSSCAADLMKLESLLNAQEGPVHGVGFADALKALMDALWRESVTPEKPVVVVGGGTDGRATPGPKMSSAKRDQQYMGVRDIENGRFKTPAAAAAHIVQLALPQWKDEGYTEKNRASLAQAIRRALDRAKRKKSLGAK